jgi:hypothetical protein
MKGVSRRAVLVVSVMATLLVVGAAIFAIGSRIALSEAEQSVSDLTIELEDIRADLAREAAADQARQAAAREEAARAAEVRHMEEQGWFATNVNGLYAQWLEPDQYYCGYWDCAGIGLYATESNCLNSVYVEANLMSGESIVGYTNGMLGSLPAEQGAALLLENHTGMSNLTFELTEVSCY